MRFRSPLAVAALLCASLAPAAAQETPPQETFGELIEVRVVNVEVVVTDRDGNRVSGLGPGDFRLTVDGKQVPIEYFTEVVGGQAVAPTAAEAAPLPGLPALSPGEPVGTSYLVFIDDLFAIEQRRDSVLRDLKADLARLGPQDRMAVVAFDGRSLEMLSSWSNSQNQLERAFDKAMLRRGRGLERLAERRSFEVSRRNTPSPTMDARARIAGLGTRLDFEERAFAERLSEQVRTAVAAAVTTLRGFASPPGRKVMLLLSGGWPYSPADYTINDPQQPIIDREVQGGADLFRPLVDTANLLGYTVYPVDVPGLEAETVDAAADSPTPTGLNVRENEIHRSLEFVADETGGRPLLNAARGEALARAAEDTRSYYWLGFSPTRKRDDGRHDIEVAVLRPGLSVRSREDYLDVSRTAEISMMVESALLFGNPPGTQPLPIQVGAIKRSGRREIEVPVTVAIPVDSITIIPVGGEGKKWVAELELRVAAVDEDGRRAPVPVVPLTVSIPEKPEAGKYIPYTTTLRLRRAKQRLIVAVFDRASGVLLTAETQIIPPAS
ncbi:MAG TPA: VWA domain-containing protein [Thermoanaerobaculia bacterium]|nr:VWA domain-containing protein [Thermoanaerobaculia bacterium]